MRRSLSVWAIVLWSFGFVWLGAARGQTSGAPQWTTDSFDPQRDGWQRDETKLTKETVGHMQLLWKVKTDNKPIAMHSFREPLIVPGVSETNGTITLAILAGSSDDIYAIDADSGTMVWQKHLGWSSTQPQQPGDGRNFLCPNALTATPVVTPAGKAARMVYAIARDGYLHALDLSSGEEKDAPLKVLTTVYGKPYGLNLVDDRIYTTTGQGCGGVPNAVYEVDLKSRMVTASTPAQHAGIWGVAGPAVGNDGTIYAATGDGPYDPSALQLSTSVLAFTPNDLRLQDYYTPTNHEWLSSRDLDINTTPVVFPYKGRDLLVVSGKEGRYILLDSKSLGGEDHQTPLYRTGLISNAEVRFQTQGTWGNLTSWEDKDGIRWVLAPIGGPTAVKFPMASGPTPHGGVIALRLEDKGGKPELTPGWLSRDMMTAETPVIANGMVFVLDSGEFTGQYDDVEGGLYTSAERIKRSVPAKLYVLDAETGKQLYSSGEQVVSFLHQSGIAVAGGRVIFGTFDGTVYCFGLK
jgi:outer membrane protein assembly factor BamB